MSVLLKIKNMYMCHMETKIIQNMKSQNLDYLRRN